ncbi:4-hydroxy-tetrahydrodipicolinate synthase [Anaerobacterium chartisolvens]|uniref:4-hydroxy-tetrahydrodipicolinate synthase n=1 Tax=Anaerobacterium chartisolvens TaxID=1297424 RepID=A0A369AKH9_9FIRM|nr:dihydrodipicolinate synthase family protein [Anaerobacterium chartisolvens]RCX08667.1 4-hydroxy-tetrahydrodipicolinate synthase [Anaerobacterium chartisolvens]
MKKLHGVITAMLTPFDNNDKVDTAAIKKHVDFLVEGGVNCLYPLGTTGEMYLMTVEERKLVAETVVRQNNKRLTAFIHAGAMSQADTIALAKHAYEIGADGIGVVTPSYFKVNDREMEEYYVAVAKSVPEDFPVYTYNIPQLSGNDLKPEVVEKIVRRAPNVIGIKYSYPDMNRTVHYTRINNNNFSVVQGADTLMFASLMIGCDGIVSGCSSVFPEFFANVYRAYTAGDYEEAARLQKIATRGAETIKCGSNMSYFKEGLKMRGIDMGHMRKPLLDIGSDELAAFSEEFGKCMELL